MERVLRIARRVRYRTRQVLWGLPSGIAPADAESVRELLSPAEFALFVAMESRDRTHAVRTLNRLDRGAGAGDRHAAPAGDLRVAALVHDVGKGRLALGHRVAYVLLHAASPALLDRLARRGRGWRGALWRIRHHALLGGGLLREAGSAPRVVELVERHTAPPGEVCAAGDADLALLVTADGDS